MNVRVYVPPLGQLLDLVLPARCAGCGAPPSAWCSGCADALQPRPFRTTPNPEPAGFPHTVASGRYDGVLRASLLAHKEYGRAAARPALAGLLGAAVSAAADLGARSPPGRAPVSRDRVVVVPVPSRPAAVRNRGGDPLLAVSRAALRHLPAGVVLAPLLRHTRDLADQAGLDATQRAANLRGAFEVDERVVRRFGRRLEASRMVVVDDICTTGATLSEAARAIGDWTGQPVRPVVTAAVMAATQRRHQR